MDLLVMDNVWKSFGANPVLQGVSLHVKAGEIHALLGENGAGKSTLMNILTGTIPCDKGTITFDGETCAHMTIRQSEEMGMAFVHQELNLFNDMRVWENIFLTKEVTGLFGHVKKTAMIAACEKLFNRLGVDIDPRQRVGDLRPGERQLLEISKALNSNAKLLILDEPTTSLNGDEVERLFKIVESLKKDGMAFIFISHKMPEIFAYADRYTVLRNGQFIATGDIKETTPRDVTGLMVGHDGANKDVYEARDLGETVLSVSHLSGKDFTDVSLESKQGEIIGLTGLQGCGSTGFLQCLFGLEAPLQGTIRVHGETLKGGHVHEAMRAGIGLLPADRKENSLIPDMSLTDNMTVSEYVLSAKNFVINKTSENVLYDMYRNLLNIKAEDGRMPVTSLSGGNQQKVFMARWLCTGATVLLFDNPTQGIDVGAKAEIYTLILELARKGHTILVNTLEIPELQKVADKCLVFADGRVVKELAHDDIEEHTVMMYATGSMEERQ